MAGRLTSILILCAGLSGSAMAAAQQGSDAPPRSHSHSHGARWARVKHARIICEALPRAACWPQLVAPSANIPTEPALAPMIWSDSGP